MIVVTGATRTIGSTLIQLLSESGVEAKAVSGNPPGQSDLPGISWIQGDLAEPASLNEAFAGGDKLFFKPEKPIKWLSPNNAIRAADEAGIQHVVKLSALGASDHSRSIIGVWHIVDLMERKQNRAGVKKY